MATTTTTTPLDSTTTNTGATPMMASMDAARHPTPQEFSQAVTKIAVAHLALGVGNTDPRPPESHTPPGFTTADTRAVALLSDVIGRYIETIGLNATKAVQQVARLATGAKSEYVQLEASKDILDRAGYKPIDRSQVQVAGDIRVNIDLG